MSLAIITTLRRNWHVGIAAVLFIALFLALLMMVDALENSERFEYLYSYLLLVSAISLLALLALIGVSLNRLFHQVRKGHAGARLTVRLMGLLIVLTTLPVLIIYYFSLEFVYQRLDNWFNVNIEMALDLSRATLNTYLSEAFKQTQVLGEEIALLDEILPATNLGTSLDKLNRRLNDLRHRSGALELTLLADNGNIIASSSAEIGPLLPHLPPEPLLLKLQQNNSYSNVETLLNQGLIRVVSKILSSNRPRLLYAIFPLPERIRELANNVETYKERAYLHEPFKLSLTLVLSLVLLLCLFGAIWMSLFAARRFVNPLIQLAEATQAVAKGDYEQKLPVNQFNELSFLVYSFNEMTLKIAQARDAVKQSELLADRQRAYLQAVLERLSSGVISLDWSLRLRTANPAANHILGLPLNEFLGENLSVLAEQYSPLQAIATFMQSHLTSQDWRGEITVFSTGGRKILTCCGTQLQLTTAQGQEEGYVIVFDDVTALIQAQRNAAWSEVARRLAHEIKNPLTPIQLSAERLRHKYLPHLSGKDADLLERMTHTIIQQVEAMRSMVNAFSDYARTPTMHLRLLDINQLVREVLDLYYHAPIPIKLQLADDLPNIQADKGHLRQVLHNLIKNALEADSSSHNSLTITTLHLTQTAFECVELRIQDRGPGIPKELLERLFEPYVTTKTKGTGLGLAIVKKIVEEHGGMVWIENMNGACVVIRLPIAVEEETL
jgi:PAS domain S-box-containing protein